MASITFQIYVAPVPKDMEEEAFEKAFSGFGQISKAYIITKSRSGQLFGFVDFTNKAGADAAVAGMNGKMLAGGNEPIEVSEAKPQKPRAEEAQPKNRKRGKKPAAGLNPKRLYIGKISDDTTDESLMAAFGKYGELAECYVVDSQGGRNFAFATFDTEAAAVTALSEMDGASLDGAEIEVSQAKSEKRAGRVEGEVVSRPKKAFTGEPASRLFVGQLPYSVNNGALRGAFDQFGEILECYVVYKDRRSRRFGFVIFEEPAAAAKALAEMNGYLMGETEAYEGSAIEVQLAAALD